MRSRQFVQPAAVETTRRETAASGAAVDEFCLYLACEFQAGKYRGLWTHAASADDAIRQLMERGSLLKDVCGPCEKIVRTEVIAPGMFPGGTRKRSRHTHSYLERIQPRTLFVGTITDEALRAQEAVGNVTSRRMEAELQEHIKAVSHLHNKMILFEHLPERWQRHIRCAPNGCWFWETGAEAGPYKAIYIKMKAEVPKGVVFRHSCDNRLCANPNHLSLGSPLDNVRDMISRNRHGPQRIKDENRRRSKVKPG